MSKVNQRVAKWLFIAGLLPTGFGIWLMREAASPSSEVAARMVTGVVLEADTETTISGVKVSFRSTGSEFRTEVETDSLGRFELDSLPLGFGLLHVSRSNYAAPGIAVTVNPEYGHEATFVMATSRPRICPSTRPA